MLDIGTVLQNRYRIISLLGQGGMGAVYHAWDIRLSIPVALKEMIPQPDIDGQLLNDLRQQFQQEATVLARLNHPHLVGVTDFFEEGRNVYLVMKFVEGESLSERINLGGALAENLVLSWSAQLLDALSYCHNQGVIHRDIKPQNIVVRPGGDAVLVDFGLAKLWNPNDPQTRTAVRGIGTPQYAPPEQYEMDSGHTEPRSDLYSLGATMYHALTGKAPPTATLRIATPERYAPIRTVVPEVRETTAQVIERAMELACSRRWPTAAAMAQALKVTIRDWGTPQAGVVAVSGAPQGHGGTVKMTSEQLQGSRRRPALWVWGLLGVIGLGVAALLYGFLWGGWDFGAVFGLSRPSATSDSTPTQQIAEGRPTVTMLPSLTLTADALFTVTQTLTPTATTTSTAILTPTLLPTEDAGATPVATLTARATPTPANGGRTATPSPTPKPVASGALITFEQWRDWRRGDQANGTLSQTQEQVKSGGYAAKLAYSFPSSGDDYVIFIQSLSLSGQPNAFSAWVYGDGSGHFVNLWVQDARDEIWAVYLGRVGASGWQQMSGRLAPGLEWPSGHISGPDNGVVDYPVRFHALVLDRPGNGSLKGQVYVDDISVWTSSAALPTPLPTPVPTAVVGAEPTSLPTADAPIGDVGRIVFTVQIGENFYLYSTDPSASQMTEIGRTDWDHSTCMGGATASTLTGQVVSLYGVNKCNLTERTDACTSPDGAYKVITNRVEGGYTLSVQNVAAGSDDWYYQGSLNTAVGIQWAYNSQHFIFGVDRSIFVVRAGVGGYAQAVSSYDDAWPPQFSPGGDSFYYLMPVGVEGASDVVMVNLDGSGLRNLSNAPIAHKFCPRWRR